MAAMVIGLSGYSQSGKDTVAQILVDNYGYKRVAFADAIRNAIYTLNPIITGGNIHLADYVDELGWEAAKRHPEVRRLLQVMGTEVGRQLFDESVWIEKALGNAEPHDKIVITDVRFPNEAKDIKWLFGEIWRINRPAVDSVNSHISESAMDQWQFDRIINNDADVAHLEYLVHEVMRGE
jgi:hypothetical protein